MEMTFGSDFSIISSTDLQIINAGDRSDYNFGYKIGQLIRVTVEEIWYSTFGFYEVY